MYTNIHDIILNITQLGLLYVRFQISFKLMDKNKNNNNNNDVDVSYIFLKMSILMILYLFKYSLSSKLLTFFYNVFLYNLNSL